MKIVETQNFASLFLFAGYFGVSGTLRYSGGGDCSWISNYSGSGILVALVVLVALDFIDALVF